MQKIKVLFPLVEAGLGHIMPLTAIAESFKKKYGDKVEIIETNFYTSSNYPHLKNFGVFLTKRVRQYNANSTFGYFDTIACEFFGTTLSSFGTMVAKNPKSFIEGVKYMEDIKPDVVFSTHWATNYYAEKMKKKPFTIMYCPDCVMNKLFKYHADLTLISMPIGYKKAKKCRQYNENNFKLVPFLIRNKVFSIPTDKFENRKNLNLPLNNFTITLAEGGYGIGRMKEICERLVCEHLPLTIIAVCGKNDTLYEYFKSLKTTPEVKFIPFAFTEKILEYEASSDLFIGKSGNIIAEPTFFGVPSIISNYSTTIEKHIGEYYINDVGCAIKEFNVDKIISLIKDFIANPEKLVPYQDKAKLNKKNYGAEYTADLMWQEMLNRFPQLKEEKG